jgi:hypothetical protein
MIHPFNASTEEQHRTGRSNAVRRGCGFIDLSALAFITVFFGASVDAQWIDGIDFRRWRARSPEAHQKRA